MSYRKSIAWRQIALDWQWVTLRSWCQMNRNFYSSPVKHKVEGKPHKTFEKLKRTSEKSTLFGHFLWSIFRWHVFTYIFFLIRIILPLYFTHVWLCVGYVFALLLAIWWFCFGFGDVSEKEKTRASSWFQGKVNYFEHLIFNHFYDSHWYLKKKIVFITYI